MEPTIILVVGNVAGFYRALLVLLSVAGVPVMANGGELRLAVAGVQVWVRNG